MSIDKHFRIKRVMRGYFMFGFIGAGAKWTNDNDVEINELVDLIIEAAKEEIIAEIRRRDDEQSGSYAEYKQRYGSGLRGD